MLVTLILIRHVNFVFCRILILVLVASQSLIQEITVNPLWTKVSNNILPFYVALCGGDCRGFGGF